MGSAELRDSFVSIMPACRWENIARLVGHSRTTVTELVYQKQIKPVLVEGAAVIDRVFSRPGPPDEVERQ